MKKESIHIVFTGMSGFPYGMAAVQKQKLLAEGLSQAGCNVMVFNKQAIHKKESHPELKAEGVINSVRYIYTSGTPFRSSSFVLRNLKKLSGIINEFRMIASLWKNDKLNVMVLYTQSFNAIIYYRILCKLFSCKILYVCGELRRMISSRRLKNKLNDYFIDNYAFYFIDAVLPISDLIIEHIKKRNPRLPVLKVPVLVDISRFSKIQKGTYSGPDYFLFCGAATYFEIIEFIFKAFGRIEAKEIHLFLVTNGNKGEMKRVDNLIKSTPLGNKVKIFSGISDDELNKLYINALGLLIPLRPTMQDKARFPHKIGEYLLSASPVITTMVGEIPFYLKNMETAFIANDYDVNEFAEILEYVIENPIAAKEVGLKGKVLAETVFDHIKYGRKMKLFIHENLIN